ncbi:hypothetical protein AX16_009863 [Volvariella volvacea WC 439]|nr:hypothetical protein AX16_009863 [Volvariella volvacea WC 439]
MPAAPKNGPALFLGIELATDQLRASIVDESLELVGVECVDFDAELSEYQTQGGMFTTPGDAYTTPVEMWIKGLDTLFEKLRRNYDLTRIRAIGGSAQHALVWWKSTAIPSFVNLDHHLPLHAHITAQSFTISNTPIAQDTSSHQHALAIEARLGGPDLMAARVGTCANASLVAAQLLRVRETWQDVWSRTGRVQLASAFLASLITGRWINMSESEACATGMWVHSGNANISQPQGHWDEGVLEIVAGNREEARRVRTWLGDVDISGGNRRAGNVSRYLVDRYGFDPETVVTPFVSDYLSAYLSLCPSPNDAVLSFGPMDMLMTPAQHYIPTRLYNLYPHPAQDSGEKRRYIAIIASRNADVPRALVRDMYTKSWSAFDRLVAIVPPGGSIGLDDKLFSFWHLQADAHPFSHVKGIFRFETGIKVNEFRDLRANPRCLLESQILSFRTKWSRMIQTGILGSASARKPTGLSPTPPPPLSTLSSTSSTPARSPSATSASTPSISSSLGLTFDPYDYSPLPTRIITTGAAANFPSVANLVGDIFNAPVFIPHTQVDAAQLSPHRNAPATGFPGRAALGAAYLARWVWAKEWGSGGLGVYEDEMRRLLGKRWVASGGVPLKTNVNGVGGVKLLVVSGGAGGSGTASGANSGTSTPYGHGSSRLGASIVVEEDEEEALESERNGAGALLNAVPGVVVSADVTETMASNASSIDALALSAAATGFAAPVLNPSASGGVSPTSSTGGSAAAGLSAGGANSAATPTTPTPLTPVTALPTNDTEAQLGLAKVAEPDVDAFMTYAAIVSEYCRLEGLLVKGIV